MKVRPLPPAIFRARLLYEAGDTAPNRSAQRAEFYRQAAAAQREAEAAKALYARIRRATAR